MSDLTIQISADIWQKNHQMLFNAKDNAIELSNLNENNKCGMSDKKNRAIGKMYADEIRAINALLEYSVGTISVPM